VVVSRGHGAFAGMLLGSVSEHVCARIVLGARRPAQRARMTKDLRAHHDWQDAPDQASVTEEVRSVSAGRCVQVEDETAFHVDVDGYALCMVRSQGCLFALHDECSHRQVRLSAGEVDDGFVECWLHGSRFRPADRDPRLSPRH